MSYAEKFFLIESSVCHTGAVHRLNRFYSNDEYVRNRQGEIIFSVKDVVKQDYFLYYVLFQGDEDDEKTVQGFVKDTVISERIIEYIQKFYTTSVTNCSSFAHFLITGKFIPCQYKNSSLVLTHTMTTYSGQKIEVGDMICILYYSRFYSSRNLYNIHRTHYRSSKRNCTNDESFFIVNEENVQVTFSSQDLIKMFLEAKLNDYHFLVCVDNKNGKPVFVQQLGKNFPTFERTAPIVFSVGGYDPYMNRKTPPFLTLIWRK